MLLFRIDPPRISRRDAQQEGATLALYSQRRSGSWLMASLLGAVILVGPSSLPVMAASGTLHHVVKPTFTNAAAFDTSPSLRDLARTHPLHHSSNTPQEIRPERGAIAPN